MDKVEIEEVHLEHKLNKLYWQNQSRIKIIILIGVTLSKSDQSSKQNTTL